MREFLNAHRALVFKHARTYVRTAGEKIPAEDVARELELELSQLEKRGVSSSTIASPDHYLRAIVKHACGRAKRRRKLVEQVAAGDDLEAVGQDLAALDGDLPEPPSEPNEEARAARKLLDQVRQKLEPRDALVFALLVEDDGTPEDIARSLAMPLSEIDEARRRIVAVAAELGIEPADSPPVSTGAR